MITSFRARALARDWEHHVWLLERVIESMLGQKEHEVVVVVACHDIPESCYAQHPRVHFLPVEFPPPERNNDDMCVDKVLKLSAGAAWAVAQGCGYVMFNDADDLVSNRIGGLVAKGGGAAGWYSTSEYFYTYGGRLVRDFKIGGLFSGPCVISRTDLLEFGAPPYEGKWVEIITQGGEHNYLNLLARHGQRTCALAAVGLQNYRSYMAGRGVPLLPMPFAGNIVINHSDSMSHVPGGIGAYDFAGSQQRESVLTVLRRWKQRLRRLPTMRLVTPALRREFTIPPDSKIPSQYLSRGSLFWR